MAGLATRTEPTAGTATSLANAIQASSVEALFGVGHGFNSVFPTSSGLVSSVGLGVFEIDYVRTTLPSNATNRMICASPSASPTTSTNVEVLPHKLSMPVSGLFAAIRISVRPSDRCAIFRRIENLSLVLR